MRSSLLLFAPLLFTTQLRAQLIAGEVPPGVVVYELDITISPDTPFAPDSVDIELDCDDFVDVRAMVYRGAPEIDAPHAAQLHFIDDDIQVCMDMPPALAQRPRYYEAGQALTCDGPFAWQYSEHITLGDHGGFLGIGPNVVDSMYIAFRRGDEVGWLLLSFRIDGNPFVRMTLHEVLPLCQGPLTVGSVDHTEEPLLFPNPSPGGTVRVTHAHDLRSITVIDATGRLVSHVTGPIRSMEAPDAPGTYLVRAELIDGRTSTTKLVRY